MVETVARAIHHAHLRNLIHRDLKPANLILNPQGEVALVDFGAVKDSLRQTQRSGRLS